MGTTSDALILALYIKTSNLLSYSKQGQTLSCYEHQSNDRSVIL